MNGERCTVGGVSAARWADTLSDIENDAREAVFIKVDFLTIGDLTYCTELDQPKYYRHAMSHVPHVGESGRQVGDKSSAKERRSAERCAAPFFICMFVL